MKCLLLALLLVVCSADESCDICKAQCAPSCSHWSCGTTNGRVTEASCDGRDVTPCCSTPVPDGPTVTIHSYYSTSCSGPAAMTYVFENDESQCQAVQDCVCANGQLNASICLDPSCIDCTPLTNVLLEGRCGADFFGRTSSKYYCDGEHKWWRWLAVGVGIGGFLLIVAIVMAVCACCRRANNAMIPESVPIVLNTGYSPQSYAVHPQYNAPTGTQGYAGQYPPYNAQYTAQYPQPTAPYSQQPPPYPVQYGQPPQQPGGYSAVPPLKQ